MKLLEYRGKELFKKVGISLPDSVVVSADDYESKIKEFLGSHKEVLLKAQVIGGKRKKLGLIDEATDVDGALEKAKAIFAKEYNKLPIESILVEEKVNVDDEYYFSIVYDSGSRKPMIMFIKSGGIDVEDSKEEVITQTFSPNRGLSDEEAKQFSEKVGLDTNFVEVCVKAVKCFRDYDCRILEINPLIKTQKGFIAGDAKVTIDDSAVKRVEEFKEVEDPEDKTFLSPMEMEARKIDEDDHRGVSGKTFVEFDGDIAVLASGGGASLTCMDAMVEAGGKAANYTEYSGNPPKEKVVKLTKLTLSKKGLNGCLVVGGTANFTDIFETLSGFVEGLGLVEPKVDYPIIIRRAGPRDKEAKEMVERFAKDKGYNITFYGEETPMTVAVKEIVQKVKEYKNAN
ncbi:MAG: ATP citrate lyase citrate-binding domain-containing protein [Candidatus Woesearchaeota archaeon]|jgi:succinyl-CoA synthetase beta subunit|nr:ATP citrate lyase citrate-binding domain-containing protein [Candidatus Woesearchaeota archaeon]MDP7324451.1 ATP citrate lyase citrate-binding domain-containing protein [Candidatus Woesearchaeota archaeon]MDP7457119.1 ATP citrate lyase citrate-binding domain-containing protein [Candidatus Woesearchaeota archaeon]